MADFLPVLLGSDANVYGMARSFYMEYGVTSLAIGKGRRAPTANSKLVQMAVGEPGLENDEVFRRKEVKVWVCTVCGHIEIGTEPPEKCPVCEHPQGYFEIKADNF